MTSINSDYTAAQARYAAAQTGVQMAQTNVTNAKSMKEVQSSGLELKRAYSELNAANAALAAAQKTADLMKNNALGRGGMVAATAGLDAIFGTNASYVSPAITANNIQNASNAALFAAGAQAALNNALDGAVKTNYVPQSSYSNSYSRTSTSNANYSSNGSADRPRLTYPVNNNTSFGMYNNGNYTTNNNASANNYQASGNTVQQDANYQPPVTQDGSGTAWAAK